VHSGSVHLATNAKRRPSAFNFNHLLAKWSVPPPPPPGGGRQEVRGRQGALEVGPSERVVRLFTNDVTLDQTSRNWRHFKNPIHRIQNILTPRMLHMSHPTVLPGGWVWIGNRIYGTTLHTSLLPDRTHTILSTVTSLLLLLCSGFQRRIVSHSSDSPTVPDHSYQLPTATDHSD
jgi:hypothetical protein